MAGVAAAAMLNQQGRRVLLVDPRASCPPVFRAEKIEREPLRLLGRLGLLEALLPQAAPISEVCAAYDGRVFKRQALEQLGITYADMVNTLREQLPEGLQLKLGWVEDIACENEQMRVVLQGGEELSARLVVLACGVSANLLGRLGLRRRVIRKEQSVALGFNVVTASGQPFPFQAVTYYPGDAGAGIDYLTLFKVRQTMRANLFVFRSLNDAWVREFHREPRLLLERALPKLPRVIGEYRVAGKVEAARVDLYRTEGAAPDGVVLIGDAQQNVCPSTGLGLKKVFTDIDVLGEMTAAWFATPGMGAAKLEQFYQDPRKRAMDGFALASAEQHRRAVTDPSPRWRLQRALVRAKWNLSRPHKNFAYPVATLERA